MLSRLLRVSSHGSPTKGLGLLSLLLGRRSGGSTSMLPAVVRSSASATRAPAATLMDLGRGRACFCAPTLWRGRRRSRPSEATAVRRMMISTAGEGGGGAAGVEAVAEEGRRVQGMISSMSYSSISAYKQCPQLFFYRYILGLKTPPTLQSLKGIAVHEVLSLFFTLEKEFRDLERLHDLFRQVMARLIAKDKKDPSHGYRKLFESQEKEHRWVVECLDLVANFVTVERQIQDASGEGDPEHVELRMMHTFGEGDAGAEGQLVQDAAAAAAAAAEGGEGGGGGGGGGEETAGAMSVTGVVDRLDRCADGTVRVVDYKTGKVPELKYPEATNKRIMDDNFFQLQIYALLVERVLGEVPGEMRLVYLKGARTVTRKVDPAALASAERELRSIWDDIARSVRQDSFAPRTSRLCDWCSFQDRCPAFQAAGLE